ncbi:MAG: DUF1016 family protein [Betaproteobacteria bacterium]|nr:DUF1016 family protein [Betaproteobacteria bacterium]
MGEFSESVVEDTTLALLESLGWTAEYGPEIAPGEIAAERKDYSGRVPEIRHLAGGELRPAPASVKIRHTPSGVLDDLASAVDQASFIRGFSPALGWSHYQTLLQVDHKAARLFYEIEAERDGWSVRHLERQIHGLLFARLIKSRDKAGALDMAREGQALRAPIDTIKDPYVLDFLDLPEAPALHESQIESAIIAHLQEFLLELGKGFAFVARQKRLTFEDEHLYVDLVFYNCILKCYVLVDLKIGRLTHQDVGQMDGYVRLFDDRLTSPGDNPTIGLILCAQKNDAVAKYSVLSGSKQIFAAKYLKYLPTEAELRRELQRERHLLDTRRSIWEKP